MFVPKRRKNRLPHSRSKKPILVTLKITNFNITRSTIQKTARRKITDPMSPTTISNQSHRSPVTVRKQHSTIAQNNAINTTPTITDIPFPHPNNTQSKKEEGVNMFRRPKTKNRRRMIGRTLRFEYFGATIIQTYQPPYKTTTNTSYLSIINPQHIPSENHKSPKHKGKPQTQTL
jgi:hypothetical protein